MLDSQQAILYFANMNVLRFGFINIITWMHFLCEKDLSSDYRSGFRETNLYIEFPFLCIQVLAHRYNHNIYGYNKLNIISMCLPHYHNFGFRFKVPSATRLNTKLKVSIISLMDFFPTWCLMKTIIFHRNGSWKYTVIRQSEK